MSDDMQRLLIEQAAYYSGRDSEAERIAELEEKLLVLTIQNNARGVVLAGYEARGLDRRAEHLARQQLESQREANARLTDEVERLEAENARLREALIGMDQRIWTDPQVIERAGEWRTYIAKALARPAEGRP